MRFLRAAVRRGEASDVESLWIADSIALRAQPGLIAQLRRRADVRAVEPDRELRHRARRRWRRAPSSRARAWPPRAHRRCGRRARPGAAPSWPCSTRASSPASRSSRPPPAAGSTRTTSTRRRSTRIRGTARRSPRSSSRWRRTCASSPRASSATAAAARRAPCTASSSGRSTPTATRARATRPSVVNGSWDDGGPGHCETEFNGDLAALRAAGIVPVFAAGNSGPGASTGASPASAPGAVAVGSVTSADVVSSFSGRGPSPCGYAIFPTIAAYGDGIAVGGPGGETVVSGHVVRRAAGDRRRRAAAAMYPGATPEAIIDALVRGARDVGAPGADTDTGAGILNVAQAAALLAGADHAGPRVSLKARWSKDADHPGLVLSGRAHERGGGTSDGVKASAFISRHGIPASPFPLSATPLDPSLRRARGHRRPAPGAAPDRRPAHAVRARARRRRQLGAGAARS